MPREFRKTGVVGRTYAEVTAVAGPPTTGHFTPDGGKSAQWLEGWLSPHHHFAVTTDAADRVVEVREPRDWDGRGEIWLSWRLRALGDIVGMPQDDIIWHLGRPNHRWDHPSFVLLQWIQHEYHVALKFSLNGECLGITQEYGYRGVPT